MYKLIRFSGTSSKTGTEHCVKRNLVPLLGLYSRCKQVCTGSPCEAELRLRSRLPASMKYLVYLKLIKFKKLIDLKMKILIV
jgi:hypothetical protein